MQTVRAQIFIPDGTTDSGTANFIPMELENVIPNARVQCVSIVELGKRLLKSAQEGLTAEVRDLMSKGAPFSSDWLGTSPLHMAAINNHRETCEVLLRAGISRDARTKVERTPLHMAAYEGHIDIVRLLLSNGADIDARDMLHMTPLHWAVQNGHTDIVLYLIQNGASIILVDKFQRTAVDIAAESDKLELLEIMQVLSKNKIGPLENSTIELKDFRNTVEKKVEPPKKIEIEDTVHLFNEESISSAIQLLREHNITMLQPEEKSVVATAMENGHSIILTEAGKQVLNSTKADNETPEKKKTQKIITVTPDQFLAMANRRNIFKQVTPTISRVTYKPLKRIVMNKNKLLLPTPGARKQQSKSNSSEIDTMMKQLAETEREIEKFKLRLREKEAEAEKYKKQLQSLIHAK